MKKKVLVYILVLTLVNALIPLYADKVRTAKLVEFKGTVHVKREASEKKMKAFKNMTLSEGDTLITGEKSKAVLALDGDKKITVSARSTIVLSELSDSAGSTDTAITLKNGGVGTKLDKKLDKSSKYRIKTPTTVMGVRGTEFYVQSSIFERSLPSVKQKARDKWRELNSLKTFLNQGVIGVELLSRDNSSLIKLREEDERPEEFIVEAPKYLSLYGTEAALGEYSLKGLHREFLEDIQSQIGKLITKADYDAALAEQAEREEGIKRQVVEVPETRIIESDATIFDSSSDSSDEAEVKAATQKRVSVLLLEDYTSAAPKTYTLYDVMCDYEIQDSNVLVSYAHTDGLTYRNTVALDSFMPFDPVTDLQLLAY